MAGFFCSSCGAALSPGATFCGSCGAAQAVAPPARPVPPPSPSALPWIVALVAVLLLGVAGGYILLNRSSAEAPAPAPVADSQPTAQPAAAPAADNKAATAVPATASPVTSPARVSSAASTNAGGFMGSYTAYIGREDLYASDGVRLSQPWQILRQDRANVHRFGISQPGDSDDRFFASASNRAAMERMVMQGSISPAAARAIVTGGVTVDVSIYGDGRTGRYLDIRVN